MSRTTLSTISTLSKCLALLFIVFLSISAPSLAAPADPIPASSSSPSNVSENQRPLVGPDPSQDYVLYWDEIVLGIVFMIIGILECFWGYRLIRLSMFVVGYLVFSSLTFFLILLAAGGTITTSITGAWIIIFVWFLSGAIGSIVCFIFWHFGLALLALYGGFQLGLSISGFANIQSYPGRIALIVLFMAVLVVLTRLEERHIIIVATSLGGAFTFVWGIDEFAHQGFRQMTFLLGPDGSKFKTTPGLWGELAVAAVFFAAGTGYEYWAHEIPDPSKLFGDGTRKVQEEIKHIEDEIEGAFRKFWRRKIKREGDVENSPMTAPPSSSSLSSSPPPPSSPPSQKGNSTSSWSALFTSFFRPKHPSPDTPLPPSSSPSSWWTLKSKTSVPAAAGRSSWFGAWFRKGLDKGKGREGEEPATSWWGWLSRIPRRGEPKFSDGQMKDISEITG